MYLTHKKNLITHKQKKKATYKDLVTKAYKN